jgi:hypothetical protein
LCGIAGGGGVVGGCGSVGIRLGIGRAHGAVDMTSISAWIGMMGLREYVTTRRAHVAIDVPLDSVDVD